MSNLKRRGRPSYPKKAISVWIDRQLYERVKARAKKLNRSISNYLSVIAEQDMASERP